MTNDYLKIISDAPLKSLNEIRNDNRMLDYKLYVENIFEHIRTYQDKSSITIGIEGTWGSGKSTIQNFLIERIKTYITEEGNKDAYKIIEFNPWYFTDCSNLISQFFQHMSNTLQKEKKLLGKVSKGLEDLSRVLNPASTILMATLPHIGLIVKGAAKYTQQMAEQLKPKQNDIFEIKNKLEALLSDKMLKTKIIVFIDDLDRMPQKDIRAILQMIKSVGNLSNIIYIISYDRQIVSSAVKEENVDRNEYLEKIIQAVVRVPVPYYEDIYNSIHDHFPSHDAYDEHMDCRLKGVIDYLARRGITYRQIKQIMNRFSYRRRFDFNCLSHYDLFLLSILEALYPKVYALILQIKPINFHISNTDEFNSFSKRKQIFKDSVNELPEMKNGIYSVDSNQRAPIDNYTLVSLLIKSLLNIDIYSKEVNPYQDKFNFQTIEEKAHKFRMLDHNYFEYYFSFSDFQDCTFSTYKEVLKGIRSNDFGALEPVNSKFLIAFLFLCISTFAIDDFDAYIQIIDYMTNLNYIDNENKYYYILTRFIEMCLNSEKTKQMLLSVYIEKSHKIDYMMIIDDWLKMHVNDDQKIVDKFRVVLKENIVLQKDCLQVSPSYKQILWIVLENYEEKEMKNLITEQVATNEGLLDLLWGVSDKEANGVIAEISKEKIEKLQDPQIILTRLENIIKTDLFASLSTDKKTAINDLIHYIET